MPSMKKIEMSMEYVTRMEYRQVCLPPVTASQWNISVAPLMNGIIVSVRVY